MKSDPANSEPKPSRTASPMFQICILTLATFMAILDSTVANVALPKMSGSLAVSPNEVIWVISSYIVANAAILPISGWLATYLGRKRYYMICVFGFTVSSVFCGLSTNLETLVVFRIFQGLFAGGSGTDRTGDHRRHHAARQTRSRFFDLCSRHFSRPGSRTDVRRLYHRYTQLALDFLYQYSDRYGFTFADLSVCQ